MYISATAAAGCELEHVVIAGRTAARGISPELLRANRGYRAYPYHESVRKIK